MHKLFRNITLITVGGLVLLLLALGAIFRYTWNAELTKAVQRENLALVQVLDTAIKEHPRLLSYLSSGNNSNKQSSPDFTALDKLVRKYATNFNVLQVNICNRDGIVVYSTDMSRLGFDNSSLFDLKGVLNGHQTSEQITARHFYALNGNLLNRDVISSFTPVDWSGDGQVDAIIQVYSDLTGHAFDFKQEFRRNYLYSSLAVLCLFFVIFLMIRTADRKTKALETEMANQAKIIKRLSNLDTLTELPSRTLFIEHLETAMASAREHEKLLAVLSLDINRFKFINERFTFNAGNELLVQIADRLKRCVRDGSAIARLGGGTFVIVFGDMSDIDDVSEATNGILEVLSEPFLIHGQNIFITFSIGIAIYPFDDDRAETLLQKADSALHQARETGRNTYRFYNSKERDRAVMQFKTENALRHALENNEFVLYYQPIMQLPSGQITGVEALLRWHSPTQGIIPPLEFISVLEESGLIIPVGSWVLETACKQGKLWQEQGLGNLKVNINISAKQFMADNFPSTVYHALETSELSPHLLNLEITESLLIKNRERVIEMLDLLNEKGVTMSVDDFGTGYSSMSYLKNMPIETIKIDKSFVRGIPDDMDDIAIIQAIDSLSANLRLDVIAEGVETREQLLYLQKLNITAIQGYLISRPLPATELEQQFQQHDPSQFRH